MSNRGSVLGSAKRWRRATFAAASSALPATHLSHTLRHAAAPLVLALLLVACDSLGEPDRFYNEEAAPPVSGVLNVADLRPGQHLAGVVRLGFDLDTLAGRVEGVVAHVDGQEVGGVTGPPYVLTLNTDLYPDGPHTVSVGVYVRGQDLGLLGLGGRPSVVLSFPLVFDQRPPSPVEVTALTLDETRRPRLEWAENADPNFYAYIVRRYPDWDDRSGNVLDGRVQVDTVYDRSATTWTGDPLPDAFGARVEYTVEAWNRAEASRADRHSAVWGPPYVGHHVQGGASATSPDGAELYAVVGPRVVAVETATDETVRSLSIPGLDGVFGAPYDLHLDASSGLLYVSVYDEGRNEWRLRVIDPATFAVRRTYRLPHGADRFAVRDGRLYAAGGETGARVVVLDAATGAVRAQSAETFEAGTLSVAGVSPDGRSVYALAADASGATLVRVDVSGDVPEVTAGGVVLPGWRSWKPGAVAVAPDGRVLVYFGTTLRAYDGTTLEPAGSVDLGGYGPNLNTTNEPPPLLLGAGRAYLVRRDRIGPFDNGGAVVEVDLATLRERRSWPFVSHPVGLAFGQPGRLYAFANSGAWVVPL